LRIIAIADTHGKHNELKLPEGDLLIHAGDVSMKGTEKEVDGFLQWFCKQDFQYKIFIAGNHDFYFEREKTSAIEKKIPDDIIYLNDSGCTINGVRFWGSPITPWFFNWAFNRHRGEAIQRHWALIPDDIDVLITHGPVYQTLDLTSDGKNVGCMDLLREVNRIAPKFHICGHIHESYGRIDEAETVFLNASVLNAQYQLVNAPMQFEM
jgi:Icc-related predicted phosphoesterase